MHLACPGDKSGMPLSLSVCQSWHRSHPITGAIRDLYLMIIMNCGNGYVRTPITDGRDKKAGANAYGPEPLRKNSDHGPYAWPCTSS